METIEKLRLENKLSKAETARRMQVPLRTYYNYLNGSKVSLDAFRNFLHSLGHDIFIGRKVF